MRAIVYGSRPFDVDRAGRTVRALRLLGFSVADLTPAFWPEVLASIRSRPEPLWLVRAGAWPLAFTEPRPSSTGRPLVALGAVQAAEDVPETDAPSALAWRESVRLARGEFRPDTLPFLVSTWLDASMVAALLDEDDLRVSIQVAARAVAARIAHFPGLDVVDDDSIRIAEVVTSAQQGGAERVALDLTRGLRGHGLRSRLVTLGRPTRAAFEVPDGTLDFATLGAPSPDHWARRVGRALVSHGFDLIHGHLLESPAVKAFAARGLPLALTIHNSREGWPAGTRSLKASDARLVVGCAQLVEAQLREGGLPMPLRTVWNGIDFDGFAAQPSRLASARAFRESLGFEPFDFVLLALANPRPQKRLHLLPAILKATREAIRDTGWKREARLLIVGGMSRGSKPAEQAVRRLEQAIDECGVREHARVLGSVSEVSSCLLASDVLVSVSSHEGLSLAQLEALAAGRPVVATKVGGAPEIGLHNPAVFLLDPEATSKDFARVLAPLAPGPAPLGREPARRHFEVARMVEGYARLLPRALRAARRSGPGEGLFLITNNFSTGGAQTSARRLLLGLRARGMKAGAAVIEEQLAFPTEGRARLRAAGIEVLATPPRGAVDPARAVAQILDAVDRDPPASVLLWNVIPEYKVLLADALLDIPLFDVSPGEMCFESLERYFADPRPGLPYGSTLEYGRRLAGVVVKYAGERRRAEEALGAPVHVIPNGVPVEEDSGLERPFGALLTIGTAARLDPRKHVDRLLRALRLAHPRLPPYVLKIAGGAEPGFADHVSELRALAADLSVEFVGEPKDMSGFLRTLDVFALVAEPAGCPNASLEAMAQGLPVVATAVGGMSEQVEDGVTGRLVGREDEAGLADALVQLAHEADLRTRMGKAGRARAQSRFSMPAMVERYVEVCASVTAAR